MEEGLSAASGSGWRSILYSMTGRDRFTERLREYGSFRTNQRHQILELARVESELLPRSLAYGKNHLVSNSNICSVPACAASVLSFAIQSLTIRSPGFSSSRFSN